MARFLLPALLLAAIPTATFAQGGPAGEPEGTGLPQDAKWLNQQQAALAQRQAKDGWSWLDGGVLWRRTKGDGTGAHPTIRDTVTLHYAGTLIDGSTFDSSYGGDPATFPLADLIPAWQVAVPQMGVGDTIEIAVPAGMGYGLRGAGPIPPSATLLFKIELLGIDK